MQVEVVGGPLDGLRKLFKSPPVFLYLAEQPPHRGYRAPGRGRLLHKSVRHVDGTGTYLFIDHTHLRCPGCGVVHRRVARCHMCGTALREPVRS